MEFKKIIDELGERFNFNELDDIIEPEGSTKIDLENDVQVPEETTESTVQCTHCIRLRGYKCANAFQNWG